MRKLAAASLFAVVVFASSARPVFAGREDQIAETAADVLDEISASPERAIPSNLLRQAQGIAIIPGVVKAGFILGIRHGRGVVLVRQANDKFSNPVFIEITGGSVGFQAGAQSSDVILVFKNKRGIDDLLRGKQLTLGADVAIAAGPVGRQAEADTDARLSAEIYSYSRSRGLFAGVSLGGSQIKVDNISDHWFYRSREATVDAILSGKNLNIPQSAIDLRSVVERYASPPPPSSSGPAPR